MGCIPTLPHCAIFVNFFFVKKIKTVKLNKLLQKTVTKRFDLPSGTYVSSDVQLSPSGFGVLSQALKTNGTGKNIPFLKLNY